MEMERKERGRNGKREQKQRVKETQRTRGRCRVIMRERGWGAERTKCGEGESVRESVLARDRLGRKWRGGKPDLSSSLQASE